MHSSTHDAPIVMASLIAFAVFFALHVAVFRKIGETAAVRWFFTLVFLVGLATAMVSWMSSLLFLLLSCCYFMGIFGIMATSVRMRILTEIARGRPLTYRALLLRYNREVIVRSRLARLVASGDIAFASGKYRAGGRITFFMVPAFMLKLMKTLYG